MNALEIFNKYFMKKIILYAIVFIIIFSYGFYKDKFIDSDATLIMLGLFVFSILSLGFGDYWFYEKRSKKIILGLLNETPLKEFNEIGFLIEEDNKMCGLINNFRIILSLTSLISWQKSLIILIPLKIKEGLEEYFIKLDDLFKLTFRNEIIFAEALIGNYGKMYSFDKLRTEIENVTMRFIEKNIQLIELIEEDNVS